MRYLYRYMDTVGDGSGTKIVNGDYSASPQTILLAPPAGDTYQCARLIVHIGDTNGMSSSDYGNVTGGISPGISIKVKDANQTIVDITDVLPITSNGEWARLCYDSEVKTWGSGDDVLSVRFTFSKSGQTIDLRGDHGEYLEITLAGDYTGLTDHTFMIQGAIT